MPGLGTVITTVSGRLSRWLSLTISWTTYTPATSARKVGLTAFGLDKTAVLPAGREVNDQLNVSESWSTSLEALPSNCTVLPRLTFWSGPALATGREFTVLIVTVSGALLMVPSFTIS